MIGVSEMKPVDPVGPYVNGIFPESNPGFQGSWTVTNPLQDVELPSPVRLVSFGNTGQILMLSKRGEVYLIDPQLKSSTLVLDIKDRTFKLGDCGSVGIALHPDFNHSSNTGEKRVFIYYKYKPEPDEWADDGFNRLSSFEWDSEREIFDPATEEILIQQYDRSTWHDGGSMFFGPDGFLYLAMGDEGYESFQTISTQSLSDGLFSGIIRIDIDNDLGRSHPIRRQPKSNGNPPVGWGQSFSQGYSIPNDNPWLDDEGSILEEFIAIGIRSPFVMSYDHLREKIWLADVGSDKVEEINLVDIGDNCQWPYFEGDIPSEIHSKPEPLIGHENPVYFQVDRSLSSCIIGGDVYRGNHFPYLNGKYIFADFNNNKVMTLSSAGEEEEATLEVLIPNLRTLPIDLPEKGGITGVYILEDGNIWISFMGENFSKPGRILQLKQNALIPEPPSRLSDLGVFSDLTEMIPISGIIPYEVNSPLYSDGALKKRWISIPNDGTHDSAEEKIIFSESGEWKFPAGTVFIKHFEMQTGIDESEIKKLETRFLIVSKDSGAYGLTYKWNDDDTDAFLLGGSDISKLDITSTDSTVYEQVWTFPSRDQCLSCHNESSKFVLGVKTHQINKDLYYPELDKEMNQLEYFEGLGLFNKPINKPSQYLKSYTIEDEDADLHWRIRSYLDANCSSCHRPGATKDVYLDFRLSRSLRLQSYFDVETSSHASLSGNPLIKPGSHEDSEIWLRDASLETNKMPPLGRSLVDQSYVDSLAYWIDNLDPERVPIDHEVLVFPNPTPDWLVIKVSDNFTGMYNLSLATDSGRIIRQESLDLRHYEMYLGHYPSGKYFLIIEDGTKRIVKKIVLI